ncbi:hypothetical protein [Bradyrhizobium sp. JR3.5]
MNDTSASAVTAERLNAALDLISEVMVIHGRPQFAPYVERLERELALLQASDDVMARARRRLEQRCANDNKASTKAA